MDTLRTGVRVRLGPVPLSADPVVVSPVGPGADVELRADPGGEPLVLTLDDAGRRLLTVGWDPVAAELRLSAPDRPDSRTPVPPGPLHLRMLLDGGVVEVFPGGAVAAAQLRPSGGDLVLGLSATAPDARLQELVVHGMASMTG